VVAEVVAEVAAAAAEVAEGKGAVDEGN